MRDLVNVTKCVIDGVDFAGVLLITGEDTSASDAAWLGATAAAVAAAIALVALYFTFRQARHARVQAESAKRQADAAVQQKELQERALHESNQPHIWADFRLDTAQGSLLRLIVRNEGPTVAEDVQVVFDPPLQGAGLVKDLGPVHERLARGLQSMPPGREMVWAFALGHKLFSQDSDVPRRYRLTIKGRGPYGSLSPLTYVLDLDELQETAAPRLGTLDDIAKAIRDLGNRTSRP